MYRIAVIGDPDSVLGFKALGLEVCPAEDVEQARQAIHRMAKENMPFCTSPSSWRPSCSLRSPGIRTP